VLLQAVFYGHRELARFLVQRGADTAITTARGLGPFDLAKQFEDQAMMAILAPHDSPTEAKAAYYARFLARIAPAVPPAEAAAQVLADRLAETIVQGLAAAGADPDSAPRSLAAVRALIETGGADVNRLAGPLQQPALIVAVTGNNGQPPKPAVAALRLDIARLLLDHGADPARHEMHPMGAQTVIRAAVFNHLDILKACGRVMTPAALADAINEYPVVNGLTALHDTVLRATMASPEHVAGYVEQARWFVQNGGRSDIEDFAGTTQRAIAERCEKPDVRAMLLEALAA
jgi:ankyrin repeat protein